MTPRSELELEGNFLTHPFAELLREIAGARLYGSLRFADGDKKSIFYFRSGAVVFAVSNQRSSRLFDILVRRKKLSLDDLGKIPNFSSDFELTSFLQENNFLSKGDCDRLFAEQIEGILIEALGCTSGSWSFSSLARLRDEMGFVIDSRKLLTGFARCLTPEAVLGRFRTQEETFKRTDLMLGEIDLSPAEAFVLSRVGDSSISVSGLASISGLSEADTFHAVYTLWICGYLDRVDWQPAFTEETIALMRHAKLELRKEAKVQHRPASTTMGDEQAPKDETSSQTEPKEVQPISLDEYLERVEAAETYYDVLGVNTRAEIDELKRAYFSLAKVFHPDLYHAEGGATLNRVQNAFRELAQAHETLKNVESRELYDYRMRKELADRERRRVAGDPGFESMQLEKAAENFEQGFSLLMDDEAEEAIPFLARAVHYAPKNPKYHAYYGKALSGNESQRHKAEAEMQAAVKLDPNNATFRILLAELFIQFNLLKRAEGELGRLLAIFPSNREAQDLLAGLNR